MAGEVRVVGVYPVDATEPCHLVELLIESDRMPDFNAFTQPVDDVVPSNWQVPYDEKLLDASGEQVVADLFRDRGIWPSRARVTFFFHYLQPDEPLQTPFGQVPLPRPVDRPKRLRSVEYEQPG